MGDPSLAHSAGDGLHRGAQRVQQRGQLPGAFGLPALLHDEAGHGDHIGVEGAAVGHGGRCAAVIQLRNSSGGLNAAATRNCADRSVGGVDRRGRSGGAAEVWPSWEQTRSVQTELDTDGTIALQTRGRERHNSSCALPSPNFCSVRVAVRVLANLDMKSEQSLFVPLILCIDVPPGHMNPSTFFVILNIVTVTVGPWSPSLIQYEEPSRTFWGSLHGVGTFSF